MSKKTLTILIIIFSIIVIGLFIAAFFLARDKSASSGVTGGIFNDFFPTEEGSPSGQTTGIINGTTNQTGVPENGIAVEIPALRQITSAPVAGTVAFARDDKTYIRYIEKSTGNVYETETTALGNNRITNTTIPRISLALWNKSGREVVIRYVDEETDTIKNFAAKINESKNALEGIFLRDAINELAVSPDTDKIFYTVPFNTDTVGAVANFDGTKVASIFTSPFSEWLVSWPRGKTIALATKPSFAAAGYLYFLNTQTEALDNILGNISGLTALASSDGKRVAYSKSADNSFTLNLFTISDRTSNRLSINTLPEKCVWASDAVTLYCAVPSVISSAEYPDSWYQGTVSFSDSIWKINTETGFTDLIMQLEDEAREPIDVIQPILNSDGTYLIFINKKDSTLWSLKLAS